MNEDTQQPSIPFSYTHPRAVKARFGVALQKHGLITGLEVLTAISLVGMLALVTLAHSSAGWLLGIVALIPFIITLWYRHDLSDIPPKANGTTVEDRLESGLLGRLPKNPTPKDIAVALHGVSGVGFLGSRFGINSQAILQYSSDQPGHTPMVWRRALEYADNNHETLVNNVAVAAALTVLLSGIERYLSELHIDETDIAAGVRWYSRLKELVVEFGREPLYGGIARDWAFGFTPMLEHFGSSLTRHIQRNGLLALHLEGHEEVIARVLQLLTSSSRHNAVLVGGPGSGRSTIIQMLADQLIDPHEKTPKNLRYNQVVTLDPSTLIAEAAGRGELEQLVQQLFAESYMAKNIILFLDNAQLFLEDGTGSVNLANVLLPFLEGGALRIILSMDEQQWLHLAQTNPNLAQTLNRVSVEPLSREDTFRVMQDHLISIEHQVNALCTYQALNEAYNLSERYIPDQVMPGKALNLLEAATQQAQNGFVTAESVQQAIEKTYNVKVGTARNGDEREVLLNLEQLIHQRMINQSRAVQVVADALRRARAGVRNQKRPIGTFLFLGPTGVGKTELAKAIAAIYFGGEDRLVRVDLNEYVRSDDLIRLIADGGTDPNSLAAKIAKQPFSVVLLDEIEKAHPDVLSALLQLLDEGVLRDRTNREVSFRDAIIIATSNAGANQIRAHIEKGEEVPQFEQAFTDELINSNQFRPEFLNRFDEIVIFRPLKPEELLQVVDLILQEMNRTLSVQKITLDLTVAAKQELVRQGYDPRLGARPLRRVVQRSVENVMAQRLLAGTVRSGDHVTLDIADLAPPATQ
jgi:ATP-dependent Clp protease ATP-binding subunit ClpC